MDAPTTGRDLGLAGLPNARDLGGYRTSTGDVIRHGVLFRADAPVKATDDDLAILDALGIVTVVDLRGATEAENFGVGTWPVPRVHLPVSDVTTGILADLTGGNVVEAGASERTMIGMYRDFVASAEPRRQFAAAVALIAAPGGVPLLFHCTAGKDRTGWLAAIVLTALGVDRDTVTADYLLTNERFTTGRGAVGRARLLASMAGFVDDIDLLTPLIDARASYLDAAFDEAESCYGSIGAFLRDGLDADVAGLRANLLEP